MCKAIIFVLLLAAEGTFVAHCPYRLADIFKNYGKAKDCACVNPNSLACFYIKNANKANDIKTLARAVSMVLKRKPWLRVSHNVSVIHVRAGDGILGPNCFTDNRDCFFSPEGDQYSAHKVIFDQMQLNSSKACLIFINTQHCTHHGCRLQDQEKYLFDVVKHLKNRCASVNVKKNNEPDEAFVSMATADNLFLTGGGFGKLARKVHKYI
ncbi:MAG: hypothetical protein CL678_16455 [Bdellovibrionaceae bacterium]|nr:hypothetical protein [Pseudobdellovibrionaceae bacterium]|tara:strand:+ start:251 stop:880 length:630 start_codon:yes stop_codon:yes gene_type:complete